MLEKLKNYWGIFTSHFSIASNRKLLSIIAIVVVIIVLPLTVLLSQQQQTIRQRASELVSPPGGTAAASINIDPTEINQKIGETFTVPVMLHAKENNITGVDITIMFDKEVLELVGFEKSPVLTNQLINTVDNQAGTFHYAATETSSPQNTGDIKLGALNFKARSKGVSSITFQNVQIINLGNSLPLNTEAIPGKIAIVTEPNTSTTSTTIPSAVSFGKALSLNGNSCAEVENPTQSLNFAPLGSTDSFAINGWFKANNLSPSYIIARENLVSSPLQAKPSFTVGIKDGYLEFIVNSYIGSQNNSLLTAIKRSDKILEINKWYYFMAKRDPNAIDLYINGKRQGIFAALENTSGSALDKSLTIGCQRVTKSPTDRQLTGFFNGEIDDIVISEFGLNVDEIPIKPYPFNAIAVWHLDGNLKPDLGIENELKPIGNIQFVDSTIINTIPSTTPIPTSIPTPTTTESTNNRVFLTSTDYNGNFGGLSGADAKCQERADATKLGGIWKAWLSDDKSEVKSRIAHYSNTYKLINGKVIASNWADLTDGTLQNYINITELGTPYSKEVWTGTKLDGSRRSIGFGSTGNNCSNWTSSSSPLDYGSTGLSYATDIGWTDLGRGKAGTSRPCDLSLALYCFEQPAAPSPTPTPTPSPVPTKTPTPTPIPNLCTACSADVNKDGTVDSQDLSISNSCSNRPVSVTCSNADINKDGRIDVLDTSCVGKNFGKKCIQPSPIAGKPLICGAYGDVNGDKTISQTDTQLVLDFIVKKIDFNDQQKLMADVDGNGKVDVLDSALLTRYTAGTSQTFPACTVPTQIAITAKPSLAKGDFNIDKSIDILDYQIWRDEFLGRVKTKKADINNDGKVNIVDFGIWRNAFRP